MAEEDLEGRRDVVTDVEQTGWLFYRPVVAVGILVVGGIVAYGVIRLARQRKQRKVVAA